MRSEKGEDPKGQKGLPDPRFKRCQTTPHAWMFLHQKAEDRRVEQVGRHAMADAFESVDFRI